jgi:hypothetical protein
MAVGKTLTGKLETQIVEMREGSWRCALPGLGLVVHGSSSEEAAEKLIGAFSFLIDYLLRTGGYEAVRARLDRAEVDFELTEAPAGRPRTLPLRVELGMLLDRA